MSNNVTKVLVLAFLIFCTALFTFIVRNTRVDEVAVTEDAIFDEPIRAVTTPASTGVFHQRLITACQTGTVAPFWSCDDLRAPDASTPQDEALFYKAVQPMCEKAHMKRLLTTTIPCTFAQNFRSAYNSRMWIEEAFVTYIHGAPRSVYMQMTEALVESVHQFSTRPIIVFCVTADCHQGTLKADRYPRLLVINIEITQATQFLTKDLYKWLGAVLARVNTGFELDADQLVLPQVDTMFPRIRLHSTAEYPYPVLPVHWMSRDPEAGDYADYAFKDKLAFKRTMRWGHAHPVWTHHALPWLGSMVYRMVEGSVNRGWSDEDVANVLLWEKGLKKLWCKFDNYNDMLNPFLTQSPTAFGRDQYADKIWFPHGVPLVFTTLHNAKKPKETLEQIEIAKARKDEKLKLYFWNEKWYSTPDELMADNPPCVV